MKQYNLIISQLCLLICSRLLYSYCNDCNVTLYHLLTKVQIVSSFKVSLSVSCRNQFRAKVKVYNRDHAVRKADVIDTENLDVNGKVKVSGRGAKESRRTSRCSNNLTSSLSHLTTYMFIQSLSI